MSKSKNIYCFTETPKWVTQYTDDELVRLSQDNEKSRAARDAGNGLCYLFYDHVRTSENENEYYELMLWELSNSNTLQSASTHELSLLDHQHLDLHRIGVIREGKYVSKDKEAVFRVIDNEQALAAAQINKQKKVVILLTDLRLNDVICVEYTKVGVIDKDQFADKRFFRHIWNIPGNYWYYRKTIFRITNERGEDLNVFKKYFRNDKGEQVQFPVTLLTKGKMFAFEQDDSMVEYVVDILRPYIEVVTKDTWGEISSMLSDKFAVLLSKKIDVSHPVYIALSLGDPDIDLEQKIVRCIDHVQNEIVYLFDAETMHGHMPQEGSVTLERRSGDCKAKALLLANLLNTIGVVADLVLVNYDQDIQMDKLFEPSPFIFDHMVVRIKFNNNGYLIDATWRDQAGKLEFRAQPILHNYLVINKETELTTIEAIPVDGHYIDEKIEIEIKEKTGSVKITTIGRKRSADIMRGNFARTGASQSAQQEGERLKAAMGYPGDSQLGVLFPDSKYLIVTDNKEKNEITSEYSATLAQPYITTGSSKVVKLYYPFDSSAITNFSHKDLGCYSFIKFPIRHELIIKSDLFVQNSSLLKRNTKLDNKYFSFSNVKKVSSKMIQVSSKYSPKIYSRIDRADLESIKKDLGKINESNYGAGAQFISGVAYVLQYWYVAVIALYAVPVVLGLLANQNFIPIIFIAAGIGISVFLGRFRDEENKSKIFSILKKYEKYGFYTVAVLFILLVVLLLAHQK